MAPEKTLADVKLLTNQPKKTRKRRSAAKQRSRSTSRSAAKVEPLRIIGGRMGGRKLVYNGLRSLRPMKERVREATFNLIGPSVKAMHAIDLFAGTGALGLESLSRGAAEATMIERHFPTARTIVDNVAALGVVEASHVVTTDAFDWVRRMPDLGPAAWLVFCSPPYDFYVERLDEMLDLIGRLVAGAPGGSILVVEADQRFDFGRLPTPQDWNVRRYLPAFIGILRLAESPSGTFQSGPSQSGTSSSRSN